MDLKQRLYIQSLPGNNKCINCGENSPQWASTKFGILICLNCSGKHRGLGVHTDFVRSLTLDSWTDDQITLMKAGGNTKCNNYFQEQGINLLSPKNEISSKSIKEKYESQVAQHYKQILQAIVKGEPIPPTPVVIEDRGHEKSCFGDDMAELVEKVQQDSTPTFQELFRPAMKFAFKNALAKILKPKLIILFSALFGGTMFAFPDKHKLHWLIGITEILIPTLLLTKSVRSTYNAFTANRLPPFKSAQNLLLEGIQTGRAKRNDNYDIFFPPKRDDCQMGLILFPGALVNHTAYATIARKLSDEGILVIVMSLEPLRFSMDPLETSQKKVLNVMYEIISREDVNITEWALGGHSAGGTLALQLVGVMKPGIRKLVLWGVSSTMGLGANDSLHDAAIEALVLCGSEDGFLPPDYDGNNEWGTISEVLPPVSGGKGTTKYCNIEGGNHSGFGHYGPQLFPRKDGTRTITLEKQQKLSVRKTADFLSGKGGIKKE